MAFLQARKCDEAQGYYFSRPVLPEQFAKLLKNGIAKAVSARDKKRFARLRPRRRYDVAAIAAISMVLTAD